MALCSDDGSQPYNDEFVCGGGGRIAYDHSFNAGSGNDINLERVVPLPDFWFRGTRDFQTEDGHFYCVQVENIGMQPVGPAPLTIRADGTIVKAAGLKELGVNETTEYCVQRAELPPRQLELSYTVDEPRQIPEMNDRNNTYELTIPASQPTSGAPGAAPSPQPKPSGNEPEPSAGSTNRGGEDADLTVHAIRVNGQAPNGKNDCKSDKNDLTVVVKNAGKGDAGSFSVRLTVDGADADAAMDGLNAGQEREVHFAAVQLKAGAHTLRAVADAGRTVAESKEDNNELKITARCS